MDKQTFQTQLGRRLRIARESRGLSQTALARLIARSKVTDKYIRRQRYYVVVETRTTDEEGQDIVRSRDTFLLTPVRIPDDTS